jgi:hypothetical protein
MPDSGINHSHLSKYFYQILMYHIGQKIFLERKCILSISTIFDKCVVKICGEVLTNNICHFFGSFLMIWKTDSRYFHTIWQWVLRMNRIDYIITKHSHLNLLTRHLGIIHSQYPFIWIDCYSNLSDLRLISDDSSSFTSNFNFSLHNNCDLEFWKYLMERDFFIWIWFKRVYDLNTDRWYIYSMLQNERRLTGDSVAFSVLIILIFRLSIINNR